MRCASERKREVGKKLPRPLAKQIIINYDALFFYFYFFFANFYLFSFASTRRGQFRESYRGGLVNIVFALKVTVEW